MSKQKRSNDFYASPSSNLTTTTVLPNEIMVIIDDLIYHNTPCYFDFINWHMTCKSKWSSLENNLYGEYMELFIIFAIQRNKSIIKSIVITKGLIDSRIFECHKNIIMLNIVATLCKAMNKTVRMIHKLFKGNNDTQYIEKYMTDVIKLDSVENLFPIFNVTNKQKKYKNPTITAIVKKYVTYMKLKGYIVSIGSTRYDTEESIKKLGSDYGGDYELNSSVLIRCSIQNITMNR